MELEKQCAIFGFKFSYKKTKILLNIKNKPQFLTLKNKKIEKVYHLKYREWISWNSLDKKQLQPELIKWN